MDEQGDVAMMYGFGWGGGLGGWVMMLGGLALLVGLVLLVAWGVGGAWSGTGRRGGDADGDRAAAILRERYARGEISEAEYEQGRRILGL